MSDVEKQLFLWLKTKFSPVKELGPGDLPECTVFEGGKTVRIFPPEFEYRFETDSSDEQSLLLHTTADFESRFNALQYLVGEKVVKYISCREWSIYKTNKGYLVHTLLSIVWGNLSETICSKHI